MISQKLCHKIEVHLCSLPCPLCLLGDRTQARLKFTVEYGMSVNQDGRYTRPVRIAAPALRHRPPSCHLVQRPAHQVVCPHPSLGLFVPDSTRDLLLVFRAMPDVDDGAVFWR